MTRYLRKLLCTILLLALFASCASPALASSATVKVNSSSARVYSSRSTSSPSVKLRKGLSLTLKGTSGGWAKVSYKGHIGYVPVKYLNTRKRYTAYVKKSTYLYSSASSDSSHVSVGVNTKVYVVGRSGSYYRVQNSKGRTGYILASCLSGSKVKTHRKRSTAWKSKVVMLKWFGSGQNVLRRGGYGYLYDIKTGISLKIKRMGGTNHADVEPVTRTDTAKLLKIAGGTFSWDTHACILYANGKYVACAINTKPHGDQTITTNGYHGQFCLHMLGSLTHGTQKTNSEHQAAIEKAYNWAH